MRPSQVIGLARRRPSWKSKEALVTPVSVLSPGHSRLLRAPSFPRDCLSLSSPYWCHLWRGINRDVRWKPVLVNLKPVVSGTKVLENMPQGPYK